MERALTAIDPQLWAALLGAIVGFVLSEISATLREGRQDRRDRSSVRAALHYAIDDNLTALAAFWPQIVKEIEDERSLEGPGCRLVNALVPVWTTSTWQGLAPKIAVALDPNEIGKTHRIYAMLAEISDAQRHLAAVSSGDVARQAATPNLPPVMRGMPPTPGFSEHYFGTTAKGLMPALDRKVKALLADGNPIESPRLPVARTQPRD